METQTQEYQASKQNASKMETGKVATNWFDRHAEIFENNRFAAMAFMLIVSSCLGSIACWFIFAGSSNDYLLMGCLAISMGCNSALISQVSAKWCLGSFYLSLLLNAIFILVSL